MKRIIIPALLLLVGISSCKKEDVFALWRDKSNLVIKGEATTIVTVMQYNIYQQPKARFRDHERGGLDDDAKQVLHGKGTC